MKKTCWPILLVTLLLSSCGDPPKRQNLVTDVPVEEYTPDSAAQARSFEEMLERAKASEAAAKPAPSAADKQDAGLSKEAQRFLGTWVGEATPFSPRTGSVAYDAGESEGSDLVEDIMEAVEEGKQLSTSCVWLELYADKSGLWIPCAVSDRGPSAMEKIDPFTGNRTPLGLRFTWKEQNGNVHIKFREAPRVIKVEGGKEITLYIHDWHLELGTTRHYEDESVYTIRDRYPEHNFNPSVPYKLSQYNSYTLGREATVARPLL